MDEVFEMLKNLGISYLRFDHKIVYTCAESTALLPKDMPGVRTKHLFLHDRKKENFFLITVDENTFVDYKELSKDLGVKSLSMASPEELYSYLNVEVGCLSMMSIINDKDNKVKLLIDKRIWDKEAFDCHPNKNGIVLSIKKDDFIKIFDYCHHEPLIMLIKEKE